MKVGESVGRGLNAKKQMMEMNVNDSKVLVPLGAHDLRGRDT